MRSELYSGQILVRSPTRATVHLIRRVWAQVEALFSPLDPLMAHALLGNDVFFERFAALRQGIPRDPEILELGVQALESLGLPRAEYRFDWPRIRAVSSGAHEIPAALPAYGQHRDTWYANPQAQLNHWLPLHEILEEERMGFFPEVFSVRVPNHSARFTLDHWERSGGFQTYSRAQISEQIHPVPEVPLSWAQATRVTVKPGEVLQFAAQQLHGTVPHQSGRTRYTLELRAVHQDDHLHGRGPRNVDNESQGSLWDRYVSFPVILTNPSG